MGILLWGKLLMKENDKLNNKQRWATEGEKQKVLKKGVKSWVHEVQ